MPATAVPTLRIARRTVVLAALALLAGGWAGPAEADEDETYIVQTNAAGDNVHIIDPETNEIVAEITGVEVIWNAPAPGTGSSRSATARTDRGTPIMPTCTRGTTRCSRISSRRAVVTTATV